MSGLFDQTVQNKWSIIWEKFCHHPIYLALEYIKGWHDTENELGDVVGQTHVVGMSWVQAEVMTLPWYVFLICNGSLRENTLTYKRNLDFLRSMRISLWGGTV